jgi:hypothetical protein
MCQNHQDILFIAIVNTNLIKQRNQCKISYNLSNLITAHMKVSEEKKKDKKKEEIISN